MVPYPNAKRNRARFCTPRTYHNTTPSAACQPGTHSVVNVTRGVSAKTKVPLTILSGCEPAFAAFVVGAARNRTCAAS